jgi:hypothetical protein
MFRTEIIPQPFPVTINVKDKILTTGSCFSDTIGKQLYESKFPVLVNPFGVAYNPFSIHKVLRYGLHNQVVPDHTYLESQELFANYDFHSSFSSLKKSETASKLKEVIGGVHYFLKETKWLLITYGTAWVYERKDTGDIVSNCHKMPATNFTKSLLSRKKILESFGEFYEDLNSFNPGCHIILTVSPVRHFKETLSLNSVSKSALRLACQTITETFRNTFYFPSYEIMLDDLRDYRFYKPDMIHPSEVAEEYIWNRFSDCCFDETTRHFIKKWKTVLTSLQHRPFQPQTLSHQNFLKATLKQLEELKNTINVTKEIEFVKSQLT